MFVSGEVGVCRWAFVRGPATDPMVDLFVAHIRGVKPRSDAVLIDIAHDITLPNAVQRTRIAQAVKESISSHGQAIAGHAVVTNSLAARATLTAINWLVTPEFPERVFADVPSALAWLKTLSPRMDVALTEAAVRSAVKDYDRLSW